MPGVAGMGPPPDPQDQVTGGLKTSIQNPAAAVDDAAGKIVVEHRYSYNNITTAATTNVKSGAGLLHAIIIGTLVGAATIQLYDNTVGSGTKIALLTLPAAGAGDMPQTLVFDVSFTTGLTIVTSAAVDITVSYR